MSDLIKREDAIKALEKLSACEEYGVEVGTDEETYIGKYEAITTISDLPSADRPQGEWEYTNDPLRLNDEWECSRCGNISFMETNYCSNCGAKMRQ